MKKAFYFAFFTILLLAGVYAPESSAYYKYVDKDGNTIITDDIMKLPKEYREQLMNEAKETEAAEAKQKEAEALQKALENVRVPVKEDGTSPAAAEESPNNIVNLPGSQNPAAQNQEPVKVEPVTELTLQDVLIFAAKGLGVLVGLGVMFFLIGKLSDLIGYKKLGSAISIGLTCLVLTYLLGTHLRNMADAYKVVMKQVFNVKTQMDKKNDKAEKTLKELDKAFQAEPPVQNAETH